MLYLLADTSVWLDLAKTINGQKLIVTVRLLGHEGRMSLLVPPIVVDEFDRNRKRVESDMTRSVSAQLRRARDAIEEHGQGDGRQSALTELDNLSHRLPLINQMATRNFDDVRELLAKGRELLPTPTDYERVVQRGLDKRAPFHHGKNGAADALLLEMYRSAVTAATAEADDHYCFVSLNIRDFSATSDDQRLPHPDCADAFASPRSHYFLALSAALGARFPEEFDELLEEFDFHEEPRNYHEIREAEEELFDRIWYDRSEKRRSLGIPQVLVELSACGLFLLMAAQRQDDLRRPIGLVLATEHDAQVRADATHLPLGVHPLRRAPGRARRRRGPAAKRVHRRRGRKLPRRARSPRTIEGDGPQGARRAESPRAPPAADRRDRATRRPGDPRR